MLQHLIESGQRISAAREEAHRDVARGAGGDGDGTAHRDSFGLNRDFGANRDGGANRHGTGTGEGRSRDSTLRALDALSGALAEMSNDQQLLEKRLRELHRQRSEGRAWRDILADEDPPGTMQVVSHMLACLAKASGALRKELVDTLRREGVSIPAIAKLFGVTHQRVSNLLRRSVE